MKMKNRNNLPVLKNPMNQMVRGGIPGLPDIFRDAFPPNLPSLSHDAGLFKRKLHKWKIRDLIEVKQMEAEGAEADARKFTANLGKITEAVMFGPKILNMHAEYQHLYKLRDIAVREGNARIRLLDLESQEKEAKIQQTNYQTALIAQDVELSKIETQIRKKQLKDILGEE